MLVFKKSKCGLCFLKTTITFEKHKYPRNSRGAIGPAKSRRKIPTIFQVSTILDSTVLKLPRVPQADGFPSIKLLPRKKGGSESHSFLMCPNSVSKGVHSFSNLWLSKDFVSSYYSPKSSCIVMAHFPDPWTNGKNPCSYLEVLEERTKAIDTIQLFVCL